MNLLNIIKPDIERVEQALRDDLRGFSSKMDGLLVEILEYGLLGGGKRLRPLLAVIASRLCSSFKEEVYRFAVAFEYLHLATLFHDDVIDQADTRRGKDSVVKKYGLSAAILTGDFLHARSMEMIGEGGGQEALQIFCRATRGMVDGEFLQLRNSINYNQSEEDYFNVIEGKTALLISAATEIGGILGGATESQRKALRFYGTNLGYGFQIADDLLDYLGDSRKTGKAVGNDLAEGKMTLPVIYALEMLGKDDRKRLLEILMNPQYRSTAIDEVSSLMHKCGAFIRTQQTAEQCIEKSIDSLSGFLPEKKMDVSTLTELARYALSREK